MLYVFPSFWRRGKAIHFLFVDMQTFSCLTSRLDDPADKGWKEQFLDGA